MTAHLLALTVGPVQDFIAAARRTRDLWFGSYLLSEISKAAAKAVRGRVGSDKLIFPAPVSNADLEPGSRLNVANVIVAEVDEDDPADVTREAKEAARRCWRDFANPVFDRYREIIEADIWNDQINDVIEVYAAWHLRSDDYKADRIALMRLLAARKRCRDFSQPKLPAEKRAGVPKSSLDGLRESVLLQPAPGESRTTFRNRWPSKTRRELAVGPSEELDVVGVVKRTWPHMSGASGYPSVARVAADTWLRKMPGANIDALVKACDDLGTDIIHKIDTSEERGHPHYRPFPFEGTAVFRSRYPDIAKDAGAPEPDLGPLANALAALTHQHGEPSPYLGVLVADGDRMGQALSHLISPEEHRQFSQALAGFAAQAREIVHKHYGVLVYSGGDDVLAFVPVDHCLACARDLYCAFGRALASRSTAEGPLTLSVGLAIAHFMEPLEDLLRYGRDAEKHAKHPRSADVGQTDRNGFAVHVVKRGGGPVAIRANWSSDAAKDLSQRLPQSAEWIAAQSISGRVPYDLYTLANVYESWPTASIKDAIQRDVLAVMQGKQPRGTSMILEIKSQILDRVEDANSLRGLANELLVARAIGAASGAAAGAESP